MPKSILIADDCADDVEAVRRMFAKAKILNPLRAVSSAPDAVAYLAGDGIYANRNLYPYPVLLFLDLRMPRQSGFEVLKWLSANPEHGCLCVVVLTGMGDLKHVAQAYQLGAHSFLTKPMGSEDFLNLVNGLKGIRLESNGEGWHLNFDRGALLSLHERVNSEESVHF